MLHAAEIRGTRGANAMTELHYADAARHYREAAALVPQGHPEEHSDYLMTAADALKLQGDERGDNAALLESIATYRSVLEERPRDRVPLQWALTQNNLGSALWTLGQRETGTARLEEAVAAYRLALQESTRDRVPRQWATTEENIAVALQTLGERTAPPFAGIRL